MSDSISKYYESNPYGDIRLDYECNTVVKSVAQQRKGTPVFSGVLNYFPDAIKEVAICSRVGNDQHNAGKPLHWDRSKSGDELDALTRHLIEAGTIDTDGVRHSAKVAWRALANLQKEIERDNLEEDNNFCYKNK